MIILDKCNFAGFLKSWVMIKHVFNFTNDLVSLYSDIQFAHSEAADWLFDAKTSAMHISTKAMDV